MNKAEFIEKLSKNANTTKAQTESIIDAAIAIIQDEVSAGKEVKFVGFGTFDRASRKSRNGRNPKTGEAIVIPASQVPRFRPGKDFRALVDPV